MHSNLFDKYSFPKDWQGLLDDANSIASFEKVISHLEEELNAGKIIYPSQINWFKAFHYCSFNLCKVVIIGQDPYHGEGEANGLAFSVNEHIKIPPSLKNIYKELQRDSKSWQLITLGTTRSFTSKFSTHG
jgi:uracil-DNA glycosylase